MTGHTKEPWAYRPDVDDDWGIIRAPVIEQGQWLGGIICQARDPEALDEVTLASHRAAKTDPWEANARRIVDCVNAHATIPDPAAFMEAARGMREALDIFRQIADMDEHLASMDSTMVNINHCRQARTATEAFDATLGEQ